MTAPYNPIPGVLASAFPTLCGEAKSDDGPDHGRCRCADAVVIPFGADAVWVGNQRHSRRQGCHFVPNGAAPRSKLTCDHPLAAPRDERKGDLP